jgi:hypothetical protein
MVNVIKANGENQKFQKSKIFGSVLKAGAPRTEAKKLVSSIQKRVHEGTPTKKILKMCLNGLQKDPFARARYNLKQAIMKLGPQGFAFEEFFSQVLRNYGYTTTTNALLKGKAISQEVDILAKKDKTYMIEMKYHNKAGITTDTKVAMYTHARFLDITNRNKIDASWLVTNTKCTSQAIKYAKSVGLKITTWDYPKTSRRNKNDKETNLNLREIIQRKSLYPITVFKSVTGKVRESLLKEKIVLAIDLIEHKPEELASRTGLDLKIVEKVLEEAKEIYKK